MQEHHQNLMLVTQSGVSDFHCPIRKASMVENLYWREKNEIQRKVKYVRSVSGELTLKIIKKLKMTCIQQSHNFLGALVQVSDLG
jgi:hypothetical protein